MSRQNTFQRYVFKLHSTRLRKERWKLTLSLDEAMKNGELIPLADSTALRFIDQLNGVKDCDGQVRQIKSQIRRLRLAKVPDKAALRRLYTQLYALLFKPDYLCFIADTEGDYDRAYEKGFTVNGIPYVRLLATTGGVKSKTIIFTSARLRPQLKARMDNGRNMALPQVPAKYGAYEALISSSSVPVSDPRIIVVKDCMTHFTEDILKLDDSGGGEPEITFIRNAAIEKNASDGFGLMLPERARQWGRQLHMETLPSGLVTRPYAFGKGLLVTFDFHEFARTVAGSTTVVDAWGTPRNILEADVLLTTSMLKLWDAYESFEDYMDNCRRNNYRFCVTKVCPTQLEAQRTLNYQFLQSYHLSDEQLEALVAPTIREIHEVLGDDPVKSILFLRGTQIDEDTAETAEFNYIKALQIEPAMAGDPYIRACILRRIKKQITDAKIGALRVHGNYETACGDPYALCQSIFGLPVTGLLGAGEFYSRYWIDRDVHAVVCFRAPMTCHNNIRRLHFPATKEQSHWYQYIRTLVIFNAWDTAAEALNGEDFDGDQNFLTDHPILLQNHRILPTIMCIQRKAQKALITENLLVAANKLCFGDDIGRYTNGITAQFEVQSGYPQDSEPYKILEYRIMCGQLFQQNAIDKTKGIIANDRPKHWFDPGQAPANGHAVDSHAPETMSPDSGKPSLAAHKKPYFMQYIYPQLKKTIKDYVDGANKKCLINFGLTLSELEAKTNKSDDEQTFLKYYHERMPAGTGPCIINRICWRIEKEFDGYMGQFAKTTAFDPDILKSGAAAQVPPETAARTARSVAKLYKDYCEKVKSYQKQARSERLDADTTASQRLALMVYFQKACALICPDPWLLADILIDLCYTSPASKQFAWDICGDVFIENLLRRNGGRIRYPAADPDGEIDYLGKTFTMRSKYIGSATCP